MTHRSGASTWSPWPPGSEWRTRRGASHSHEWRRSCVEHAQPSAPWRRPRRCRSWAAGSRSLTTSPTPSTGRWTRPPSRCHRRRRRAAAAPRCGCVQTDEVDGKPGCNLTGQNHRCTRSGVQQHRSRHASTVDRDRRWRATTELPDHRQAAGRPAPATITAKHHEQRHRGTVRPGTRSPSTSRSPPPPRSSRTRPSPSRSRRRRRRTATASPIQPTPSTDLPVSVAASGGCSAAAVGAAGAYSITMTSGTTACTLDRLAGREHRLQRGAERRPHRRRGSPRHHGRRELRRQDLRRRRPGAHHLADLRLARSATDTAVRQRHPGRR